MTRETYLQQVIELYIEAPETPNKARRADWAIASHFYQSGTSLTDVAHAIRLVSRRRYCREPGLPALEPICSLAYFRPLVETLRRQPHDPDYVEYVHASYLEELDEMTKTAARRRNAAVSDRR